MRRLWRAFPTLLRIGLHEAVAHRAEYIVWLLSTTMPLVMLAMMTTIARQTPSGRIAGLDGEGLVGYYLATLIVRQLAGSWVIFELVREIRDGTLAGRLVQPIHPLAAHAAESLAVVPLRALMTAPIAAIALALGDGHHLARDPVVIAAFVASLAGAWLLNFCLSAIVGTLAVFWDDTTALWDLWLACFMLFSGFLLPLEVFPAWFATMARRLPFAYLQALPVELLNGLRDGPAALRAVAVQWVYGGAALVALVGVWRGAMRRFAAFGG